MDGMKLRTKRLPIRENLYSRAVTVVYGERGDISAYLQRQVRAAGLGDDYEALAPNSLGRWVCIERNGFLADYICVVKQRDPERSLSVLAHEALHHTCEVMRRAGLTLSTDSEEAYCYYHQWIVARCLEVMKGKAS